MISENNHYRTVFVVQASSLIKEEWHDIREWQFLRDAYKHAIFLDSAFYQLRIVQRTCEDLEII